MTEFLFWVNYPFKECLMLHLTFFILLYYLKLNKANIKCLIIYYDLLTLHGFIFH